MMLLVQAFNQYSVIDATHVKNMLLVCVCGIACLQVGYAERAGAAGVLIYGDPQQVALNQSATWPSGPWLPYDGITYGTLLKDFGDPETPGTPSYGGIQCLYVEYICDPSRDL